MFFEELKIFNGLQLLVDIVTVEVFMTLMS